MGGGRSTTLPAPRFAMAGAAAMSLAASVGCERVTHAGDFQVDPGLCNVCPPSTADLRHAPCASHRAQPSAGQRYVFAWRSLHAGADPSSWQSASYGVGLDQDCSLRVGDATHAPGEPVWCDALPAASRGLIPSPEAWVPMAHGIDNSLAERAIAQLVSFAGGGLDFDGLLSAGLNAGNYTELVVLDGWNGEPDDDDVLTSFIGSSGVAPESNPPRWDGSDTWTPNGGGYKDYPHFPSYVSGGVLVADTRSAGQDTSNITLSAGGQTFTFSPRFMVRVGAITPDHLTLVTAGVWTLSEALSQVGVIANVLANGNMGVQTVLNGNLPGLLSAAADISATAGPTPGSPCAAISFGFLAEAEPAIMGQPSPGH